MYLDKDSLTNHINDAEQLEAMNKLIDKVSICLKNYSVEFTDFLDPYQRKLSESILNRIPDISYSFEGGYEEAERKSIIIYPDYLEYENIEENPIAAIEVSGNFKFNRSSHSDYLGAILGKGIVREKIGDILSFEDRAFVIVHRDILSYLLVNLDKIGREGVRVKEVEFSDVEIPEEEFEEKVITVSSDRLDNFISEIYNLSRSKSSALIESDRVKLDFKPTNSKTVKVEDSSLISVRGFGRTRVEKLLGTSKKGKHRYRVKKYI